MSKRIFFNVISRIAGDKNFFFHYLNVVAKIKKEFNYECLLNFIGAITDHAVYEKIKSDAQDLYIENQINFTYKSIPYSEMPNTENDYYLNVSIGSFVGYSSIECFMHKFKTILFNVNDRLNEKSTLISMCQNETDLFNLLVQLIENKEEIDIKLKKENEMLLQNYSLTKEENKQLYDLLTGNHNFC